MAMVDFVVLACRPA